MMESREHRLKRLHMRSIRRGIKEMDIILMRFSETHLATLGTAELDAYEALLEQGDQDLYQWVSGQTEPPAPFQEIVGRIVADLPRVER
jgi:antitoxin CptB